MPEASDRRTLIIFDADDTLWESSLYFERAEEDFLLLAESLGHDPVRVAGLVHSRDIERLAETGYGARPYLDTLTEIMLELERPLTEPVLAAMSNISLNLVSHPVILYPGVLEVVAALAAGGCRMVACTMGEADHQRSKFARSGLEPYFDDLVIVPMKTAEVLSGIVRCNGGDPGRSVMIGNSPRSDVNPALDAGIRVLHIQRSRTWAAEREDILDPGRVHEVAGFRDIPDVLRRLDLI
ncbi:HAD family hydrolase [Candidatus Fermentibacterales bacterium]|nr:HAD family hydrolase [Candidatus Fermentibacterales bacterium]